MEEKAKIVYEDEDILVLNKRAGVVCTREGRKEQGTLEEWLETRASQRQLPRAGIVHRLDKGTSGLMVVAKKAESREKLVKMFKKHEIKKTYIALICGDLPREGEIRVPVGRSRYAFGKFAVNEEGKEAETVFKLIKKYQYNGKIYSLVEINLKTGRTHQIRVHFSFLKWPLVGDKLYGGEEILALKRPFLQAAKLEFNGPFNEKKHVFECELAEELAELLKKL